MFYYKSKLFFCVISTLIFINRAFNIECIRGGLFAEKNTFQYNVLILRLHAQNKSGDIHCSGGVIAELFVLSTAYCFIIRLVELEQSRLIVSAGLTNIQDRDRIIAVIITVSMPRYDPNSSSNDIAVLKLASKLIQLNSHLVVSRLGLPYPDQIFISQKGVVSGFGYNLVDVVPNPVTGEPQIYKGISSGLLKYGNVTIIDDDVCRNSHPNFLNDMQFCGVMSTVIPGEPAGICKFDNGAPLVINGIVAGIASIINGNCDDTVKGSIYTNVSHYTQFIKAVLAENPLPGTFTFHARTV